MYKYQYMYMYEDCTALTVRTVNALARQEADVINGNVGAGLWILEHLKC